eukprot:9503635-Pyramimonas_sp.AAC.3
MARQPNVTMSPKECHRLSDVAESKLKEHKELVYMRAAPLAVAVALRYGEPFSGMSWNVKGMFNSADATSLFKAMSVTKSSVQNAFRKLK